MDTKQLLIATLAGGVTFLLSGYILYEVFWPMMFDPPADLEGERSMNYVSLIIGHLMQGGLLAYIFLQWARISTFTTGAVAGIIIFVLALGGDMLIFHGTDTGNMGTMGIAEVLGHMVFLSIMGALGGGVIGWVIGQFPLTDPVTD